MTEKITPNMTDEQVRILGREIGKSLGETLASEARAYIHHRPLMLDTLAQIVGTAIGAAIAKGKP